MLFDTDILIWVERGNAQAAALIDSAEDRFLSAYSYMELLRGIQDKRKMHLLRDYLSACGFRTLPLTPEVSHRALIYMQEYTPGSGLTPGDALIAATAVENSLTLATGNKKHFSPIKDLRLYIFKS